MCALIDEFFIDRWRVARVEDVTDLRQNPLNDRRTDRCGDGWKKQAAEMKSMARQESLSAEYSHWLTRPLPEAREAEMV